VTDSWSERPIPTEPADPQAMTNRVPEGATPDAPAYDPTRPIIPSTSLPLQPMQQPSYTPSLPSAAQARTPMSSNATGNASDKAKAAKKSRAAAKGKTANAAPFIWDSGRTPGDVSATPSPTPPAPPVPPESKHSSLQRTQQTAAPTEENAASASEDGRSPIGPPEGPLGGPGGESRGRGTRLGLILVGTLAVAALLVWVITATLPKNSTKATVAVGTTATPSTTATSLHAVQPLGTSPIPVPSNTAKPGSSVTKTTHSAAPIPPTVNVEITDMDDRLVLDVDNSGTSAGTLVGTWAVDNTTAQHWHLVAQPNGTYVIYSELADLKVGLEINTNANDYSGGTVTTLQSYDDDAAMQWTVKYLSSGEYELVNNYNGQCLTGGGQGVANATSTCSTSNTHQAWTLTN
jgi:Ricin-type beta-trefoil lectin domain-like